VVPLAVRELMVVLVGERGVGGKKDAGLVGEIVGADSALRGIEMVLASGEV